MYRRLQLPVGPASQVFDEIEPHCPTMVILVVHPEREASNVHHRLLVI